MKWSKSNSDAVTRASEKSIRGYGSWRVIGEGGSEGALMSLCFTRFKVSTRCSAGMFLIDYLTDSYYMPEKLGHL